VLVGWLPVAHWDGSVIGDLLLEQQSRLIAQGWLAVHAEAAGAIQQRCVMKLDIVDSNIKHCSSSWHMANCWQQLCIV